MNKKKQLYPLKFIPIASKSIWGGNALSKKFGKKFTESDENGKDTVIGSDENIGSSIELADLGIEDSAVGNGWLAGNTISELMETYLDRIVGEDIYQYYGRQFPLMVRLLNIKGKYPIFVNPDDEVAEQRYDTLGGDKIWHIVEASPEARIYMGFKHIVSAEELYERCLNGTIEEIMEVFTPKAGDSFHISPGTVHSADGELVIAEIGESSCIEFRIGDRGGQYDPYNTCEMNIAESLDIINFGKSGLFIEERANQGAGNKPARSGADNEVVTRIFKNNLFTINKIEVSSPLRIETEKFGRFIIYICLDGEVSVQVQTTDENGQKKTDSHAIKKGESILIPADMPEFFLVPTVKSSVLLEAMVEKAEEPDSYINPNTEAFIEGEDYEGLDQEDDEDGFPEESDD